MAHTVFANTANERLSGEIYSIGRARVRDEAFLGAMRASERVCTGVYVHVEVHTRRQINRTVTTVTPSLP